MHPPHTTTCSILMICGLALASPALAQNAIDRNLQAGSGGVNPAGRSFAEDLRLRNAIVTGNAPGGFSFRGDVGYVAPGEFEGRLGANDTFRFRRDSLVSGLAGQGIRGTEALQFQYAATTGTRGVAAGATPFFVSREGSARPLPAAPVPTALPRIDGPGRTLSTMPETDERGLSLLAMRSPSAFVANRSFTPAVIAGMQSPSGEPLALTASALRGLAMEGLTPAAPREGDTNLPVPPTRRPTGGDSGDIPGRIESAEPSSLAPLDQIRQRLDPSPSTTSPTPGTPPGDQPGDRSAPGAGQLGLPEAEVPQWRQKMESIRRQLAESRRLPQGLGLVPSGPDEIDPRPGRPGDPMTPSARTLPGQSQPDQTLPGQAQPGLARPGEGLAGAQGQDGRLPGDRPFDEPPTLREQGDFLRAAGGAPLQTLALPGTDVYAEHMARAQQFLSQSRYFDAEQRFTAAQGARPGDPMAAVGRVHAQIGAGTFVSAAISLRAVFTQHPELIAVRYDPSILPAPDRLDLAIERLRQIIVERPSQARDAGLLLAYIGHQRENLPMVREGLDAYDRALRAGQVGGVAPDDSFSRLGALLREVWTNPLLPPVRGGPQR